MAFKERCYLFKRKQKGGDGFWRQRCGQIKIVSSRMLHSRVPRVPTNLEPFRGRNCCCWFVLLLALLTVSIVIDHYYGLLDLLRYPWTVLFLGGSAEGVQRIGSGPSTRSKKLPAPAIATSTFSKSFHTDEGIIIIMRHTE